MYRDSRYTADMTSPVTKRVKGIASISIILSAPSVFSRSHHLLLLRTHTAAQTWSAYTSASLRRMPVAWLIRSGLTATFVNFKQPQ